MAIEVTWHNAEKTILMEKYPRKWTWDDFYNLRDSVVPMMNEVSHKVYIIADFGTNLDIPAGNAMLHARNVIGSFPENWGLLLIISHSVLINSFVNMFNRIFPIDWAQKIRLVRSLDEAYEVIRQTEAEKA